MEKPLLYLLYKRKTNIMKLTQRAIDGLSEREAKLKLALALSFTELWINKIIGANKDNGPLTTAKALQVIREETGLSDQEILEEDSIANITS
jgi:phage repressor protein C with HTH and peptisase S24 domain